MRTTFGEAAAGVPETGMAGHLDMHERVQVNGNGDGIAAGTGMNQKDRAQGSAPVNAKASSGMQYPFGYGDAVDVLRLVQEFDAFASLELSIGDIHISVERKQPAGADGAAAVTAPVEQVSASASAAPAVSADAVAPAIAATPAAAVAPTEFSTPAASVPTAPTPAADDAHLEKIITPTLGVFYRRPSPEAEPFVKEGDVIAEGDQIGVLEVMKLYMPINSTVSGRITRIVAQDAALVEHGEVLMLVEPV